MAKRRREPTSLDITPTEAAEAEAAYNTVFIDTSLNTHLAMLVSYRDTVSDFKEKITMEHMQCFPKFGKIKIQSLKVKRRGNFYHLPDFMLVRSAFEGIKRNWFLSAETSSIKEFNYNNISSAPDETGNLLSIQYPRGDRQSILTDDSPKILPPIFESKSQKIPTTDGHSSDLYTDANRTSALKMLPSDGNDEANVVSEMTSGLKVDDKTGANSVEHSLRIGSPPKKKHKRKHHKDGSRGPAFGLERTGVLTSTKDTTSPSEISGSGNSLVGIPESEVAQQRKHNLLEETAALLGVQQTDQFQRKVSDVFDKRSQLDSAAGKEYKVDSIHSTENHLGSGNRKEDSMLGSVIKVPENSMVEKHEMLGSDVATVQLEGNASRPSLNKEKRKKKRKGNHTENYTHHPLHKSAPAVNHHETDQTGLEENQKEFPLNHDPEVMQSKKLGPNDKCGAGGNIAEVARLDKQSDAFRERGNDSARKRSSAKIQQDTEVKHSNNLTCADAPNVELNNTKNESILTPFEICQTTEIDSRDLLANHEPVKHLTGADVTIKEPSLSAKLLDANDAVEATNSSGIKRKKKKKKRSAQKAAAKIQDASIIKHSTEKVDGVENYTRTLLCKNDEQENGFSINHDAEAMQLSNRNSVVCDKPDVTPKDKISTEKLLDTKTVVEPGSSGGSRRKKSVKKSDASYLVASGMDYTSKEENLLPLAQTGRAKQSVEVMGEKITKMEGENLSPADSFFGDLPLDEQEKQVKTSHLDQVYKNQESTGHLDKKEKEEIEKKQLTVSKDLENSPIKYQEVVAEDLTASNDKHGMTFNLSEAAKVKQNRASPLSQLTVSEMEVGKEKLKGMPETDLHNDNVVNYFENEDEGINFKSYFIPSEQQDKVASSGGIKVSTKSNQKRKAKKNKKQHTSSSVSATLNVQNSVKSYETQECENTTVIRHEKLPSNHDLSEVMLNAKNSSEVSEKLEKASSQNDVAGTRTLQKPEETPSAYDSEASRAAAAYSEGNNKSLAGSSPRSKIFTEKRRDESRQLDVANMISSSKNAGIVLNSSRQKKSLLAKSGTMFWDNVSESSGDENGTVNSNASTHTPSDSSSSSGNSVEETRNGSNAAKETVAGGKNILKSDLSGRKNITMDMLLRSSASFKKAKHIATQQELEDPENQPVEFVPDSQVNH